MGIEVELFKQGKYEELWQRCCGFIDISLDDFMMIQRRLLLEQVEMLRGCRLGRSIMGDVIPKTVEEFREQVPLTTYAEYEPCLLAKDENALPAKPMLWQYTSGRSGEYPYRWAPVTYKQFAEIEPLLFALIFFSSSRRRKEVIFKKCDKILYGMAPPPYATGSMTRAFPHELFDFLPPVKEAEEMSFEERIQLGFEMALSNGLDLCFALSSVAVAIGNRFSQRSGNVKIKPLLRRPKALLRLTRGLVRSKLARRPMLPKDLWSLKGLITVGIDGSVYKEKIKEMWGRYPLDFYGCTEAVLIAMQTWDHKGMTFIPHLNFLEFIPEKESIKARENPGYQPSTILLDEVKAGENYELVITSFHGGPFIRYRLGHLINITSLRNEELDIDIPQMTFLSRVDDLIDIAGFTRLTEKVIWQALEDSGMDYTEWTARKEIDGSPKLHIYLEMRNGNGLSEIEVAEAVDGQLRRIDQPYAELQSFLGLRPLEITLMPEGTFREYTVRQREAGVELALLKPPHVNPPDSAVDSLISCARAAAGITRERELVAQRR